MRDGDAYSGDSSYRFVDELIKRGRGELCIISPYISNFYATQLIKSRRKIRIITSESTMGYKDSIAKSLYGLQRLKPYATFLLYVFILDAITIYLRFFLISAFITIILLLALLTLVERMARRHSRIKLKISSKKFVHEKLYISDDEAIIGSANLTFNGMHRNVEHVEVIKDPRRLGELKRHFNELWSMI